MQQLAAEGFVTDAQVIDVATGEPVDVLPPEPPIPLWPMTVQLKRPILGNKREQLTELVFREPTGRDINNCGNPVRIDSKGEVQIDEQKMTLMMGQLSGVLSPLLERLSSQDWNTCAYKLRPFFLPDPASW